MPVTLSDASAGIAAIVLEQYLEDRQRELQHYSRMSAVLGTSEPRAMDERTRLAIELVLEELRAGCTASDATIEQHQMRDLLREVRTPRTLEELADRSPLATPPTQLSRQLLALEELGLVRQLHDGLKRVRWEITSAGEREL